MPKLPTRKLSEGGESTSVNPSAPLASSPPPTFSEPMRASSPQSSRP